MPHVIVEYSQNLERSVDIGQLLDAVHQAALRCSFVPADALRTRAEPRAEYRITDGHADNAFVAIVARLGPGRKPEEKHELLDALLRAAESATGDAAPNMMFSVEYQEIDAEFRINKNNLRETMTRRTS